MRHWNESSLHCSRILCISSTSVEKTKNKFEKFDVRGKNKFENDSRGAAEEVD
jgi:hypothetical protein